MCKIGMFNRLMLSQAVTLLASGLATLWWSEDLMRWLIWRIGEERVLGVRNVVRSEGGGTLLTNPVGMISWSIPFWVLGILQISSSFAMLWLCNRRRTPRVG